MSEINDTSLKSKIRNLAKQHGLMPQEVLQMYLFERFLKRLEASDYTDRFILKGGLLIASITGISQRTTMDMDATLRGTSMEKESIIDIMQEICAIDSSDDISFRFASVEPIRKDDEYASYRVHIVGEFGKIKAPMKIDLTTGDVITPREIEYPYSMMFEENTVRVMAYTLETVVAEKYETVISRGTENGRARDFYDLNVLYHMKVEEIDWSILRKAVKSTAIKRGSTIVMPEYRAVCGELRQSDYMRHSIWAPYCAENPYAEHLTFDEAVAVVESIGERLGI